MYVMVSIVNNLIDIFTELVNNRVAEVSDGVQIKCGDEINLAISSENGNPIIKFGSPAVQVYITKMGPMRLLNAVRPTLKSITITDQSFKISVDNAPDIEVSRGLV
jgi:hypothetical protein